MPFYVIFRESHRCLFNSPIEVEDAGEKIVSQSLWQSRGGVSVSSRAVCCKAVSSRRAECFLFLAAEKNRKTTAISSEIQHKHSTQIQF